MKNVLIVDDEEDIIELYSHYLDQQDNIKYFKAFNGDQAAEILNNNKIDYLFTDFFMPGKNGLEIIKLAKEKGVERMFMCTAAECIDINQEFVIHKLNFYQGLEKLLSNEKKVA